MWSDCTVPFNILMVSGATVQCSIIYKKIKQLVNNEPQVINDQPCIHTSAGTGIPHLILWLCRRLHAVLMTLTGVYCNHIHLKWKYIIAVYCIFDCHIGIGQIIFQTQKQVVPKMPSQEVLRQIGLVPHICIMR